jgi:hypothetical protein
MVDSFAGRTYKNVQRCLHRATKAVMRSYHFRIPIYEMPIRLRPVSLSPSPLSNAEWVFCSGLLFSLSSSCWSWHSSVSQTFPTLCRSMTNCCISCASGSQLGYFISSLTCKSAHILDAVRVSALIIHQRRAEGMVLAPFASHLHRIRLLLRRRVYQ